MNKTTLVVAIVAMFSLTAIATAQNNAKTFQPTHANVAYGKHKANVIDVWIAKGEGPRPLLVYIHGGGWIGGIYRQSIRGEWL